MSREKFIPPKFRRRKLEIFSRFIASGEYSFANICRLKKPIKLTVSLKL